MDGRKLLAEYMSEIINSKDEKEWLFCIGYLESRIEDTEGEAKEAFIKLRGKMKDYFNKNIKYGR